MRALAALDSRKWCSTTEHRDLKPEKVIGGRLPSSTSQCRIAAFLGDSCRIATDGPTDGPTTVIGFTSVRRLTPDLLVARRSHETAQKQAEYPDHIAPPRSLAGEQG